MVVSWLRSIVLAVLPVVAAHAADAAAEPALEVLHAKCSQCHSKSLSMSGLDLSSREAALKGGSRGPSIVAGKAGESRLIEAVERKGKLAMPPTAPLSAAEVDMLRRWVDQGASWPSSAARTAAPLSTWWSFQKVVRPAVPKSGEVWVRNEIDEFVVAKLRAASLQPSPQAGRAALARRAYLDLWGLPPTLAQISEFTQDSSPGAWPNLIDKLLASPQYGEKWGRHWLDLVRYSDTAGFELDTYIHDAWRYRDWVIQAFNDDKPYDRFIREQIAADELYPEDPVARTGTGLYCVGPNRDLFPDQADINREEMLTDYVDTTSAVFLGLTAGCARCHDHKFDPISQEDHYRIRAIFAPAVKTKVPLNRLSSLGFDVGESVREWKLREIGEQIRAVQARCQDRTRSAKINALPAEVRAALGLSDNERTQRQRELATEHERSARVGDDEVRACMTPEESARLHEIEKALVRMYADYRSKPFAAGLADWWNVAPKTFLPSRGPRPEREVQPGFFSVLGGGEVPPPAEKREATGPDPADAHHGPPDRAGELDRGSRKSTDGARDGESRLAVSLWARPGSHAQRLRYACRQTVAPGIVGLARLGVRGPRMVAEATAPCHHELGRLPAAFHGVAAGGGPRSGEPAALSFLTPPFKRRRTARLIAASHRSLEPEAWRPSGGAAVDT